MQLFSYVRAGARRTFRAGLLGSAALVVVAGVSLPISFDGSIDSAGGLLGQKAAQAKGGGGGGPPDAPGGGNGGGHGGGGGNSGGGGGNSGSGGGNSGSGGSFSTSAVPGDDDGKGGGKASLNGNGNVHSRDLGKANAAHASATGLANANGKSAAGILQAYIESGDTSLLAGLTDSELTGDLIAAINFLLDVEPGEDVSSESGGDEVAEEDGDGDSEGEGDGGGDGDGDGDGDGGVTEETNTEQI